MKNYLITVRIDIKAEDDIGARLALKSYLNNDSIPKLVIDMGDENVNVKLQEIIVNKEPRKIEL